MKEKKYLTPKEASKIADVSLDIIYRWCRERKLKRIKRPSVLYYISREALKKFLKKRATK